MDPAFRPKVLMERDLCKGKLKAYDAMLFSVLIAPLAFRNLGSSQTRLIIIMFAKLIKLTWQRRLTDDMIGTIHLTIN